MQNSNPLNMSINSAEYSWLDEYILDDAPDQVEIQNIIQWQQTTEPSINDHIRFLLEA